MRMFKELIVSILLPVCTGFQAFAMENGNTPLHEAAIRGDVEDVMALIESIPDQNKRFEYLIKGNRFGETALHCASKQGGRADVVKALLDAIQDPTQQAEFILIKNGYTPRETALECTAAWWSHEGVNIEVAKMLIQYYKKLRIKVPFGVSFFSEKLKTLGIEVPQEPSTEEASSTGIAQVHDFEDIYEILRMKGGYPVMVEKETALINKLSEKKAEMYSLEERERNALARGDEGEACRLSIWRHQLHDMIIRMQYALRGIMEEFSDRYRM
jgi:hypothetical protein